MEEKIFERDEFKSGVKDWGSDRWWERRWWLWWGDMGRMRRTRRRVNRMTLTKWRRELIAYSLLGGFIFLYNLYWRQR